MNLKIYTEYKELPIGKEEWNDLAERGEMNTPFQTWEWFQSWWNVFGTKYNLLLFTANVEEKLVGIAPMMFRKSIFGKKVITFVSNEKSDYCDILCVNDKIKFITEIIEYFSKRKNIYGKLYLRNIPDCVSTIPTLKNICKAKSLKYFLTKKKCPILNLNNCESIEEIAIPKSIRRKLNYFKKNGVLEFEIIGIRQRALDHLPHFYNQHIERWKFKSEKSLFLNPLNRKFYTTLLENAFESGWVSFSMLKFDDQVIAYHFGFDYNSTILWYKPAFDISYRGKSPGRILIKYLIDYSVNTGKQSLDFSIGYEEYKKFYANDINFNNDVMIYFNKYLYFRDKILKNLINVLKYLKVTVCTIFFKI